MRIRLLALSALAFLAGLSVASAQTVTNISWYRGGEDDSDSTPGQTVNTAVDGGTASNSLGRVGTPTYSDIVAPAANLRFGASTSSYNFDGSSSLTNPESSTSLTSNFGMEAWVNPASADGTQTIFLNGSGGDGYGLYITGGTFQVLFGGLAFHDTGIAVTPGTWTHFAFIDQFTFNTMYINGVSVGGTFGGTPITPGAAVFLGKDSGDTAFTGQIDEARIFTWSPGFSVTDLNYQTPIPEPSTYGLIGSLAALGFAAWKKRRTAVKA